MTINSSIQELKEEQDPFKQLIKEIGQYNDLDHYLDTHFRLLKEDFTTDLREGFHQFINNN